MGGKRLFWGIFLAYLAITLTLVLVLGLLASYETRAFYLDQEAKELEVGARACAAQIRDRIGQGALNDIEPICEDLGRSLAMRLTVILPSGKHIVAAHKGSVRVESTLGCGSTFSLHLPAAAVESPALTET